MPIIHKLISLFLFQLILITLSLDATIRLAINITEVHSLSSINPRAAELEPPIHSAIALEFWRNEMLELPFWKAVWWPSVSSTSRH